MTGWTDARISWPRCRPLDVPRSHPSLLVDDELYFALPGKELGAVVEKLATIGNANRELESYHRARASQR